MDTSNSISNRQDSASLCEICGEVGTLDSFLKNWRDLCRLCFCFSITTGCSVWCWCLASNLALVMLNYVTRTKSRVDRANYQEDELFDEPRNIVTCVERPLTAETTDLLVTCRAACLADPLSTLRLILQRTVVVIDGWCWIAGMSYELSLIIRVAFTFRTDKAVDQSDGKTTMSTIHLLLI